MSTADWLKASTQQLTGAEITTARLDCLVLLEDVTGKDRAWLLSHPEYELQGSILEKLSTNITQRAQHVPLAYIRGHAEFYGRDFIVNEHMLVPRPETETIIDMLKRVRNMEADIHTFPGEPYKRRPKEKKRYPFQKNEPASSLTKTSGGIYKLVWHKPPHHTTLPERADQSVGNTLSYHDEDTCIIDIGTGSGALAVTAKLEIPEATVVATDIDERCLAIARQNAERLNAAISYLHGNLWEPVSRFDTSPYSKCIVLCNLPYVPINHPVNTAATYEPRLALYGGPDGLDLYRELFGQIQADPLKPTYIISESLPAQHAALAAIARAAGYALTRTNDFIQLFECTS